MASLPSGSYLVAPSDVPAGSEELDPEALQAAQIRCARADAGRFLEYRERTTGQLIEKLVSLEYPREVAEDTVAWAGEYGYVNDLRYCSMYISSKSMGKLRLRVELLGKGAAEAAVDEALAGISENGSFQEAVAAVRKRYGALDDGERAFRRAASWLQRRGYPGGFIARVLREALGK
jgi:SOS response regulatory protein OraA/RecX